MLDRPRVDYIAPVPRDGVSGRAKASREKAAALARVAPGSRVFLLEGGGGRIARRVGSLALELRYLLTVLRDGAPDAIVTRSSFPFGAFLVRRLRGVPLFREMHADLGDEAPAIAGGNRLLRAALLLAHRFDIWAIRRADGVIFNHPQLERHVRDRYLRSETPTTTVPNGTDPAVFRPLDRAVCRQELGLDAALRYLVWVGSISPWHGVESLLPLAGALPLEYRVLVVGPLDSGHARRLLEDVRGRRVAFTGPVPPETAVRYMNAADACLLPVAPVRVSPGSALKLFDYAACGAPVICQERTEGYSDIVLETGIGTAVDFRDPATAARIIHAFLPAPDRLREHIRRTAEARFSWERRMEEWIRFIEAVT
ncbi:MAG TPA: glycosyltransferase [Candidatus Limnocylindrales bacterium]|nr:glycosyltransferase [Candidatus Limnocylindrales bacterium]